MKNILVIGGSYFAGRVLVETLFQREQYNIYVFNRGNIPIGISGIEEIVGDRDIPETIARRIPPKSWDAVVDFCAYTPDHVTSMIRNIPGTVGHYIFISTTSIYAPTQRVPIKEDAEKVNGPQPELGEFADYGYHKWLAEGALEEECRQKAVPYTVLRPAIIYGRYNYAPRESYFFDHVLDDRPLAIPEDTGFFYSFVWVDDLARIILACFENRAVQNRAFNVAGEERISYTHLADLIEAVCEKPLIRQVKRMDEIIREQIPLPFPPDDHLLYDGGKLREVLDYKQTPIRVGMRKTWQYYQKVIRHRNTTD